MARSRYLVVLAAILFALPVWSHEKEHGGSGVPPLQGFEDLEQFLAQIPKDQWKGETRHELKEELEEAEHKFERSHPCESAEELREFLREVQEFRAHKKNIALADDLYSRGWSLQLDVLATLPAGKKCEHFPSVGNPPSVKLKKSDNTQVSGTITFGLPRLWTVTAGGQTFTEMGFPGIDPQVGEPGRPEVPVLKKLIGVPDGAAVNVTFMPHGGRTFGVNLYPYQPEAKDVRIIINPGGNPGPGTAPQPPFSTFENPPFTINQDAYSSRVAFPPDPCRVAIVGKMRDLTLAQLECAGGQYLPAVQRLTLYDSVDFKVTFSGGTGNFLTSQSLSPFESSPTLATGAVLNHDALAKYVSQVPIHLGCFGSELLIFTPSNFSSAAQTLADWKNKKGISTEVVLYNNGAGTPMSNDDVRAVIANRYDGCAVRPTYVLLFGDTQFLPTYYLQSGGSDTTGSDWPYSYLDEHCFFFGACLFPDFGVGRIPVDTLDDANTVVNKIVGYESAPPNNSSFYHNAGIASDFQCCRTDVGEDGRDQRAFVETSELVRNVMAGRGKSVDRLYNMTVDGSYGGDTTPRKYYNGALLPSDIGAGSGFSYTSTATDISNSINAGRFLFLHRDHGWPGGWGTPYYDTSNISNLTNGSLLPVLFSVNCASGFFDNNTANGDYGTSTNAYYFGPWALIKNGGGAVGVFGDTRNSPTWANNAMTRGFFDAIWPETVSDFGDNTSHRRLGDMLVHAKIYLATQIGVAGTTEPVSINDFADELKLWHVIGDPTTEMWTNQPLLLGSLASILATEGAFQVNYQQEGATITALQMTESGVVPVGRAVVHNGVANIPYFVPPNPGGPVQFTATFENGVSAVLSQQNPTGGIQ